MLKEAWFSGACNKKKKKKRIWPSTAVSGGVCKDDCWNHGMLTLAKGGDCILIKGDDMYGGLLVGGTDEFKELPKGGV